MSRCFPYPPPGHEKKESVYASSGHVNLMAKEKHKRRRHKKEKDKEKRRDKHRSKDRHKEKKYRKEKHKKKDKHEEKVGNRSFKERDVNQVLFHNEGMYDGRCKAREIEYHKQSDELHRRIKDKQEIAATRMIDNSPTTVQRSFDVTGVPRNEEIPTRVDSQSRRAVPLERSVGKIPASIQRFIGVLGSANVAHKDQNSYSELFGNAIKDQPVIPCLVQQRPDGLYSATTVKSQKIELSKGTTVPGNKLRKSGNGVKELPRGKSMVIQQRSDGPCRKSFAEKKILEHINVAVNPGSQVPKLFENDGNELQSDDSLMKKTTEHSKVTVNGINKMQKSFGNDVKEPLVSEAMVIQQRSDGPYAAIDMAIPKLECNDIPVKSSSKVQKSFNFVDPSASAFSNLPQRTVDVACSVKAIGDRVDVKKFATNNMIIDQKKVVSVNPLADKDLSEKRIEAKEKKKAEYAYNEQGNRGTDRVQDKNKNKIDKLIEEEKKLTLVREEDEHEYIKDVDTRELGESNGGNLELLAIQMDKKGTNENKKRKELGLNGFVPEFKSQPSKFRKSSSHLEESGRIENSSQSSCSSMKPETINNIKSGKLPPVCNKEHSVNGSKVTDRSSFDLKMPTFEDDTGNQVSSRPPHPDSKYLDLICSIPKVEDLPQEEDLSWLWNTPCDCSRPKVKAEEIPEVWDKPIRIESADVIAMPYVIPY